MKQIYRCDSCDETFDEEFECFCHELECPENKATKACDTCKHSTDGCGDTGRVYYGCEKNLLKVSPMAFKKHCEAWEWDEGYAHGILK